MSRSSFNLVLLIHVISRAKINYGAGWFSLFFQIRQCTKLICNMTTNLHGLMELGGMSFFTYYHKTLAMVTYSFQSTWLLLWQSQFEISSIQLIPVFK